MNDLLEILRGANVALTIVTATALAVRINDLWDILDRGRRVLFTGVVSWPLVGAYGSFESLAQDVPPGSRTVLVSLSCVLVLVGLWVPRHAVPNAQNIVRNADRIAELFAHVGHLEPCGNPECVRVRDQIRALREHP